MKLKFQKTGYPKA